MDRLDVKRVQLDGVVRQAGLEGGLCDLPVSRVMTPAPSCITSDTTALELVKLFHLKGFRHLMVTDAAGRLVGVISDRDVIRCFGPGRSPQRSVLSDIPASKLMSTDLVTVSPGMPLVDAVTLMVDQGISCLPVLADDKLLGILTNTDLHLILELLLQGSPADAPSEPVRAATA